MTFCQIGDFDGAEDRGMLRMYTTNVYSRHDIGPLGGGGTEAPGDFDKDKEVRSVVDV